jgi:hypothetical protein
MRFEDVKPGMEVIFDRKSIDLNRWRSINHKSEQGWDIDYQSPIQYYEERYKRYENVPLKVLLIEKHPRYDKPAYMVMEFLKPDGKIGYISDDFFDPTNENSFQLSIVKKGRDVRNARLMAARMGLPHGPESIIASQLSGLPGNAAQQGDSLKKKAGIQGPAPDRRGFSGGKTRKGRKSKKTRRTRKH